MEGKGTTKVIVFVDWSDAWKRRKGRREGGVWAGGGAMGFGSAGGETVARGGGARGVY